MFKSIFESLNKTEQNAVKFALEIVNTYKNYTLVKLVANGTTGYPVYYLYAEYNKQAYVLRLIKKSRKCDLLSFGNPKVIWAFAGSGNVKEPKRAHANLECFTNILSNDSDAQGVINWINKELSTKLTLTDFNVNLGMSSSRVQPTTNVQKQVKDEKDKKVSLFNKLIKAKVSEAKKSSKPSVRSYITIYIRELFWNNRKECQKYWKDYDKMEEDVYHSELYKLDFSGYTRKQDISKPSGWMRYERPGYVECIKYIANPCKEFESLNKYITGILKCNPLDMSDVYGENVEGKRSDIFGRYGTTLLAHSPELCKQMKKRLQDARKSNWKATLRLEKTVDYGDRYNSYGEDMESEWYGEEIHYARVTFTTPTGKVATTVDITPY